MLRIKFFFSVLGLVLLGVKSGFCGKIQEPTCFIIEKSPKGFLNNNFYYHDIALVGHPIHFFDDTVKIYIQEPIFLLHANEFQTPYLIYPYEKIHVKFETSGEVYMYIPNNEQRTFELNFFLEIVKKTGNLSYAFKIAPFVKKISTSKQLSTFEQYIFKTKKERLGLLRTYLNRNLISLSFSNIAYNSINSVAFNDSLKLYTVNIRYLKNAGILTKRIDEKKKTMSLINLMHFRYSLEALNGLLSICIENSNPNLKNADRRELRNFILNNFQGEYQEYLLFKMIFNDLNSYAKVEDRDIKAFYESCSVLDYAEMIKAKLSENKITLNTNKDAVVNVLLESKDLSRILAEFKNKLLLIDIWASWCAPCREEFKYSEQLKDKLNGKSVEFLYLSIDENKKAWINAHKKEGLSDDMSYLLLQPDHTSILKSNGVINIPRYILIGADGKIIDGNAPRPSDPKLFDLIMRYL